MTKKIDPEVGIHKSVPFEDYCAWDCVNNSSLSPALKSGKHFNHAKLNPREDTSAFQFGRLCHEGRLEPSLVLDRYAVMPDLTDGILVNDKPAKKPRSTAEYKERVTAWEEQHAEKQIVTQDDYDALKGVLNALWENIRTREWFSSAGEAELSLVWIDPITNLKCKARLDKVVHSHLIADLKTSRDASRFESSMLDYGYDRQAAFYLDGYRQLTGTSAQFAFAVVESAAPHGIRAAPVSPEVIVRGRQQYREALAVLAAQKATGEASDYQQPEAFDLPRWAKQTTVTLYQNKKP
ncbi:MAG: PD-(D/E)XK nuclease-like domain-containing protein, partial [Planctomycetaceae bacterium]|nr:PD-(D/E)XK nuclease-like domain-containing protein [Planctomycetaceae bacterium]